MLTWDIATLDEAWARDQALGGARYWPSNKTYLFTMEYSPEVRA